MLAAEGGHYADPTVAGLLHERFGALGPGLAVLTGPGFDRLSAEHVVAHAARFLVAGNAVLHLTGPPPQGLRIVLPADPRAVHDRHSPRPRPGPTWAAAPVPGVGATVLARREPAWSVAMGILADRLERTARHEQGLSYEIGGDTLYSGGDDVVMAITVDAGEGQHATVA